MMIMMMMSHPLHVGTITIRIGLFNLKNCIVCGCLRSPDLKTTNKTKNCPHSRFTHEVASHMWVEVTCKRGYTGLGM